MSFYNREIECMPREELKKLQSERLCNQVRRCYENVECFRNRMDEKGLTPEDSWEFFGGSNSLRPGVVSVLLLPMAWEPADPIQNRQ